MLEIRPETEADFAAIDRVIDEAFGGPVESDLARAIRSSENYVPSLAFVAVEGGEIVGHVMLSYTKVEDGAVEHRVPTLSPMSVAPGAQRKGVGSALIKVALAAADEQGEPLVCLEGSPAYYGRFGFVDARTVGIHFDLPAWAPRDAGQVYTLGNYDPAIKGKIVYPAAFAAAEEASKAADEGA